MGSDRKPCLYGLHSYCIVFQNLLENGFSREELEEKWGREEWVKLHCSMCIKVVYAKAKWKNRVVVTL